MAAFADRPAARRPDMKEKLRLALDEWHRILAEAEKLWRALEERRGALEREYRGLEDPSALRDRLGKSREEGRAFLRDRIEVHIGTIQVLRSTRPRTIPLVPLPEDIDRSLSELIGSDAVRSLTEIEPWQK